MTSLAWKPLCILISCLLLASCGPAEPLRLGFLGGISGRFADLGATGRNGALLAVEQRNQNGGIRGRPVELIARDDEQDNTKGLQGLHDLVEMGAIGIVGPMTSSIAVAIAGEAERARVVLMSPTSVTNALTGRDDYFFRVVSPVTRYARQSAEYHRMRAGFRTAAIIYDVSNLDYTKNWAEEYRTAFEKSGGRLMNMVEFDTSKPKRYNGIADAALAGKPEIVILISNAVDAALIASVLKQKNPSINLGGSAWASTERLIELGGRAVEGMLVEQFFNRLDTSTRYVAFHEAFLKRFGTEPGFAGLTAFDAANVLLDAMELRPDRSGIKSTLLARKTFDGAQGTITFDATGDALRESYISKITNGRFLPVN
jgi:branched-chain amino acid transport system substrate-binding protein